MVKIKTPSGLPGIIQTFGDICEPDFEEKNIVMFDLPYPLKYAGKTVRKARCHKLLVETFVAAFDEIKKSGIPMKWADDYAGIYNARPIRNMPKYPSTHSWGIAIDLEPQSNPLGSRGKMHPRIIEIFKKHGFVWGGDFKYRKDPMHFQYAKNY